MAIFVKYVSYSYSYYIFLKSKWQEQNLHYTDATDAVFNIQKHENLSCLKGKLGKILHKKG